MGLRNVRLPHGPRRQLRARRGFAGAKATILLAEGRPEEALAAAEDALEAISMLGAVSQPVKIGFVNAASCRPRYSGLTTASRTER